MLEKIWEEREIRKETERKRKIRKKLDSHNNIRKKRKE